MLRRSNLTGETFSPPKLSLVEFARTPVPATEAIVDKSGREKGRAMSFFAWDNRYDLGVPEMNREHQKLIDLMNQLHEHQVKHSPKETITKTLVALVDYTKTHFAHEEAYMTKIRYPEVKVHQLVHKGLLEKLGEYQRSFEKQGKLEPTFFSFLKRWLAAHIMGIDMKYSPRGATVSRH